MFRGQLRSGAMYELGEPAAVYAALPRCIPTVWRNEGPELLCIAGTCAKDWAVPDTVHRENTMIRRVEIELMARPVKPTRISMLLERLMCRVCGKNHAIIVWSAGSDAKEKRANDNFYGWSRVIIQFLSQLIALWVGHSSAEEVSFTF